MWDPGTRGRTTREWWSTNIADTRAGPPGSTPRPPAARTAVPAQERAPPLVENMGDAGARRTECRGADLHGERKQY
jgi:hypothetical protein